MWDAQREAEPCPTSQHTRGLWKHHGAVWHSKATEPHNGCPNTAPPGRAVRTEGRKAAASCTQPTSQTTATISTIPTIPGEPAASPQGQGWSWAGSPLTTSPYPYPRCSAASHSLVLPVPSCHAVPGCGLMGAAGTGGCYGDGVGAPPAPPALTSTPAGCGMLREKRFSRR